MTDPTPQRGRVLSLFPGLGMLDRGFEEEGFCVLRGPDLLWSQDIREFHPPQVFDGLIGGVPCQCFSPIGNVNKARWGVDNVMPDLIPEFARCIKESCCKWWLMECSPRAYSPLEPCNYFEIDLAWFNEPQSRRRAFWSNLDLQPYAFGCISGLLDATAGSEPTVCSKGSVDWKGSRKKRGSRSLSKMLELQGFPPDWLDHSPFTMQAKRQMVGNGVPLPMSRAIARAVVKALEKEA